MPHILCVKILSALSDGVISNFGHHKSIIEEGSSIAFLYDRAGNIEYIVAKDVDLTEAVAVRNVEARGLGFLGEFEDVIQ